MDPVIAIGAPAPPFRLDDLQGVSHGLEDYRGRLVVVNFWSAECPWAGRADQIMLDAGLPWRQGVVLLSIASNVNEPLDLLEREAAQRGLPLVLRDPHHQVADLYQAVTTPHLYLIDQDGVLRYQGALDDVTFRQRTPTRSFLLEAVEALLAGRQPEPAQTPPYGCAIVRYPIGAL